MDHERIIHILNYLTRATDDKHGVTIRDTQSHLSDNFRVNKRLSADYPQDH